MTDNAAKAVGRNVRAEMARNGLTQGGLAQHLRMTQPAVSRRLGGDVPFNVNELAIVSRAVGVSLSRLVAGAERREPRSPIADAAEPAELAVAS